MAKNIIKHNRSFIMVAKGWIRFIDNYKLYTYGCISCIAYSLMLIILSYSLDIGKMERPLLGFIQKPNWFLVIFAWPLVFFFIWYSWYGFIESWKRLADNGLIKNTIGKDEDVKISVVIQKLNLWRKKCLFLSFIIMVTVMCADTLNLYQIYKYPWGPDEIKNYQNRVTSNTNESDIVTVIIRKLSHYY